MSDSIELGTVKIPGWLPGAADLLIDQAEDFLGDADGKTRKQWVMDTLKGIARAHDIKGIPNWIERPMEDAIISLVIETLFALKFKTITPEERAERRAKRRAKRAEKKAARQEKRAKRKAQQEAKG
jgi:hypothetical protein